MVSLASNKRSTTHLTLNCCGKWYRANQDHVPQYTTKACNLQNFLPRG